jgi:hypothetical protein
LVAEEEGRVGRKERVRGESEGASEREGANQRTEGRLREGGRKRAKKRGSAREGRTREQEGLREGVVIHVLSPSQYLPENMHISNDHRIIFRTLFE